MRSDTAFEPCRHLLIPGLREAVTADDASPLPEAAVAWLQRLIRADVQSRPGFLVLTGLADETPERLRTACMRLSQLAGEVIAQDSKGTTLREVSDRGTRIGEGLSARYADSRLGGSLHTDGAEAPFPVPDYFALLCIRQAPKGGALRLVHVDDVVVRLSSSPGVLDVLRSPFHFDRRGDQQYGEPPSTEKPVLFPDGGATGVTYLRDYIELGHRHPHAPPLTDCQVRALDALDEVLADPGTGICGKLSAGEYALFNNKRVLHGRTTFEDAPDPAHKRLLLRTWIRRAA
jgi:Taurine catabolism dioxygenase TauD, TfdA family